MLESMEKVLYRVTGHISLLAVVDTGAKGTIKVCSSMTVLSSTNHDYD